MTEHDIAGFNSKPMIYYSFPGASEEEELSKYYYKHIVDIVYIRAMKVESVSKKRRMDSARVSQVES